jgi:hypothetical protein
MKDDHVMLPDHWAEHLLKQPETGMDYHVVNLTLKDGRRIDDVAVVGCRIIGEIRKIGIIKQEEDLPLRLGDIVSIEVTHRKWEFRR